MDKNRKFSLEDAKKASEEQSLYEWILNYLRSEGQNSKLSQYLMEAKPKHVFLKEFPLMKLLRIMGPESNMIFKESEDKWEARVNSLIKSLKSGEEFPPLIVTDLWKDLQLSDGSHRHEALIRFGIEKYWTVFLFTKDESLQLTKDY